MYAVRSYLLKVALFLLVGIVAGDVRGQAFVTNGSATYLSGGCYQLTPDQGGQAGTIFSQTPIDLSQPFSQTAVFFFGCKNVNGADGIVFVLTTSNTALGGGGGDIGYTGISPSIAIEYDDYQNGWGDPAADHMAVISNGSVDHNAPTNLVGPITIPEIEDCMDHCFSVEWDPVSQTLSADLDGQAISYTGDIVNNIFFGNTLVYYGFTSGTGSLSNLHRVCIGPPELEPMEDVTICENTSTQLQADPNGASWQWAPNSTLSSLSISNPVANPTQTTQYTVQIGYSCGGIEHDTVVVTVSPMPVAIALNNGPLCPGEALFLNGQGGMNYQWSGPSGFSSNQANPQIPVVAGSNGGVYTVTVTDVNGCTATASTTVVVYSPTEVEIDPVSVPVCETADPFQLTGFPSPGSWSGEISSTGVFDPMNAGVGIHSIYYMITDGNGCSNSTGLNIEVVANTPALIIPDGPFCANDPLQILSATPAGGEWGESASPGGTFDPALLGPGTFEVTYALTDPNGCFDASIFIEVLAAPDAMITEIDPLCPNLPAQVLTATPAGGMWTGIAMPNGQITPATAPTGLHSISYTVANASGCMDADTIIVEILPSAPQISMLQTLCDSTGMQYTVTFMITGGDPTTYVINGTVNGILSPAPPYTFVSDVIAAGSPYAFSVDDGNACGPNSITGSYLCNCGSSAGSMDQQLIKVCNGDSIFVSPSNGVQLDPNDSLIYVLHTGSSNTLDSIIEISSNGTFGPGSLQTGVIYYVSAVVGNSALPYGVDLSDPCLSVAIGTPVILYPHPSGTLSGPMQVCEGDSAQLVFSLNGVGPFDVTYSLNGQEMSLTGIVSGHTLTVYPVGVIAYGLTQVIDQGGPGCASDYSALQTIEVVDQILTALSVEMCPGDSVLFGGQYLSASGTYSDSLQTASGCDSIVTIVVNVHPMDTTHLYSTSCDSASTGMFLSTYANQFSCDSIVILHVAFAASDTSYLSGQTCDPDLAGIFYYQDVSQGGCDSITVETIVLLPQNTTYIDVSTCVPSAAGEFIDTLTNLYGCDSVIFTTIILLPSDTTWLTSSTCDSASAGIFIEVLPNSLGCDSIIIDSVALKPEWLTEIYTTTCIPSEAGIFYDHYVSSEGCDSTVLGTIELISPDTTWIVLETCVSADTGTTVETYSGLSGCDSVVISNIVLIPPGICDPPGHDVFVPNVFSPNGDGVNDVLFIQGNPDDVLSIDVFRIFDRWGAAVFSDANFAVNQEQHGWNGAIRGKQVQPAVFVWMAMVTYTDGVTEFRSGDVTLIR